VKGGTWRGGGNINAGGAQGGGKGNLQKLGNLNGKEKGRKKKEEGLDKKPLREGKGLWKRWGGQEKTE